MSKETVNYEIQHNTDEFEYVHQRLLGTMHETHEQLGTSNGEVVPVSRENARGHFFYFDSECHTISELRLEEEHRPSVINTAGANIPQRFTQQLTVEIDRSHGPEAQKRLCYQLLSPNGIAHSIDVNTKADLQHETSDDIGAFSTLIDRFLEDFKLLER